MTQDERISCLRVFLREKRSLEEVFRCQHIRLHLSGSGHYLTPPQEPDGIWELHTPDAECVNLRTIKQLREYFA